MSLVTPTSLHKLRPATTLCPLCALCAPAPPLLSLPQRLSATRGAPQPCLEAQARLKTVCRWRPSRTPPPPSLFQQGLKQPGVCQRQACLSRVPLESHHPHGCSVGMRLCSEMLVMLDRMDGHAYICVTMLTVILWGQGFMSGPFVFP